MERGRIPRKAAATYVLRLSILATLYVVSGRLGLGLAHYQDNATLIWPPTGLSLAALVIYGRSLWPAVFLGAIVTNSWMGLEITSAVAIGVGNTLEAVVGSFLLERVAHFRPSLERVGDVVSFLGLGAVGCTLISAVIGVTTLTLAGVSPASDYLTVGLIWWMGDAGGAVVVAPILFLSHHGRPRWRDLLRLKETWLVALGLWGGSLLAFGGPTSGGWSLLAAFVPFPFVVWAGTRLGPRGAMLASGTTAVIAALGTSQGLGPFVFEGTHTSHMLLWAYATTIGTAALILAAAISERERAEGDRRSEEKSRLRLERRMNQAQRLESLGLLAGGVAHDFNNLLTAIRGNAELLECKFEHDPESRHKLEQIQLVSDRAADLCRSLLAYAGRQEHSRESVHLSELIRETRSLVGPLISKKVSLEVTLAEEPLVVKGDPTLLRQVLMNIVLNAAEAVGDREGTVRVMTGITELDAHDLVQLHSAIRAAPGRFAFFQVEDTGPGIDDETAERMFDPFFTTKFEGRGLGLAAVLGIVQSHGGAIDMKSAPDRGATFRVYLPAVTGAAPIRATAVETEQRSSGHFLLVADDEPEVRRVVSLILEAAGHRVVAVADGANAVEVFRERAGDIDLVLLDLTMPRMNGFEAQAAIRAIDAAVPIILMTGYEFSNSSVAEGRKGPLLRKPFSKRELFEFVDSALAGPRTPS